jgi:trans-aconitate methyltransferase
VKNPIVAAGHKILENGVCYDLFQSAVGATKTRKFLIDAISIWESPKNVIDLGCGTGFCIPRLKYTNTYLGVDYSGRYLEKAMRVQTQISTSFMQADLGDPNWADGMLLSEPQVVLAMGLFHHLEDSKIVNLFMTLQEILPMKSSIVSIDPVITNSSTRIARWVAKNDRGKFLRTSNEIEEIVSKTKFTSNLKTFENQIRIPADTLVGVFHLK